MRHFSSHVSRGKNFQTYLALGLLHLPINILHAAPCSSVSQYGITWTFNAPTECGQFANGDYWVVGPVRIDSITPNYANGRHGWEVNPNHVLYQGFDDRVADFDPSRIPSLPYTVQPNSSIVKAVSNTTTTGPWFLQTAAVLTVVNSIPPNNGTTLFRPPYFGSSKPYIDVSRLRPNLLPSLSPPPGTQVTLAQVASRYQRVQLDHKFNHTAGPMHPIDNMDGPYEYIAQSSNQAALRLMLNDAPSAKMPALINYVQAGIDLFGIYSSGQQIWRPVTHGLGRKLTMVFAAVLLDDTNMKTTLRNSLSNPPMDRFEEDELIGRGVGGRVIYGQPDFYNRYWPVFMETGKAPRDPYGYIDSSGRPGREYQLCCFSQPMKGMALSAHLIPEIRTVWNNDDFLTYVDRWVNFGAWSQPDVCAPFEGFCATGPNAGQVCKTSQENPTDPGVNTFCGGECIYSTRSGNSYTYSPNFGVTFGPDPARPGQCIQDRDASDGLGRFPTYHGWERDGGYYSNDFVIAMWNAHRGTVVTNRAPTVVAGNDQSITLPTNQVNLQGQVTDDGLPNPPGRTTSQWTKVSGPGTVTFGSPTSPTTTATISQQGVYILRLTANDSVLSTYDDVQITVLPQGAVNTPPQVNAGPNQEISFPQNSVNLTGAVVDDGLPSPPGQITAAWSLTSGPSGVQFGNTSMLSTTATFLAPGAYTLTLTTSDGALSSSDDVQVLVRGALGAEISNGDTQLIPCMDPSNPNHQTHIPICVNSRQAGSGTITIYFKGGKIARTLSLDLSAGRNNFVWDGTDNSGNMVSSGVYPFKFKNGDGTELFGKAAVIR